MLVLLGYLIVHMFEHTFASHLHFGEETHHDEVTIRSSESRRLIGMLVHTFFDGVAIGAGFTFHQSVGLLIFLAVLPAQDSGRLYHLLDCDHVRPFRQERSCGSDARLASSTLLGVMAVHLVGGSVAYALPHLDRFDTLRRGNGSDA